MNAQSLARGLAFFSFGLGLAEVVAPRQLARAIGVDEDYENLIRFLGLREIGSGLGILQGNAAGFVWARVGGDAIDLGLLAAALRSRGTDPNRTYGAIAAVAGVTALDIVAGILLSRNPAPAEWRVGRDDRSGVSYDSPEAMRRYADQAMSTHQSGHVRSAFRNTEAREEEAISEFEPGD